MQISSSGSQLDSGPDTGAGVGAMIGGPPVLPTLMQVARYLHLLEP